MYDSVSPHKLPPLYQANPILGDWKSSSFTKSISAYIKATRHQAACLKVNQRCKPKSLYKWVARVSFKQEIEAAEVRRRWAALCRQFRRVGMVAAWTCEVQPTNLVHYHLVAQQLPDIDTMLAMEGMYDVEVWTQRIHRKRYHKSHVHAVHDWVDYMFKSRRCHDSKRVLFVPNSGITKHGHIGPFWRKPKSTIEAYLYEKYHRRPREGMKQSGAVELARYLDDTLHLGFRKACQIVGYHSVLRCSSEYKTWTHYNNLRKQILTTPDTLALPPNFSEASPTLTSIPAYRFSGGGLARFAAPK